MRPEFIGGAVMNYLPVFLISLFLLMAVFLLVKAIRILRLSPEERSKKIYALKTAQSELKKERRLSSSKKSDVDIPIRYTTNDEYATRPSDGKLDPKIIRIHEFEQSLTTMWAGDAKPVEFTYVDRNGDKTRRVVNVDEVSFNGKGQFYLRGECVASNERRTFKVDNIVTKLKVGSNRYDFEEWCVYKLDILPSESFPSAYFYRDE
ncbi:WYL domain-containing protein [Aeromonas veronii]|nr:WYL domain-containing protein [Aeromonas veronii]